MTSTAVLDKPTAMPQQPGDLSPLSDGDLLLLAAASILEHEGWCQSELAAEDGSFCLHGALQEAAFRLSAADGDRLRWERAGIEAQTSVRSQVGGYHLAHWNDEPGRTAGEVVAAMRQAAAARSGSEDAQPGL